MNIRSDYQQKLDQQLNEWKTDLEHLKQRASDSTAHARAEAVQQIEKLQQTKQSIRSRAEELRQASDGAWDDIKSGIDLAMESLRQAIESARERYRH